MSYVCSQCSHQTATVFQLHHHIQRRHKHVYAAELFHAIVEPEQFVCPFPYCDHKSYHQFGLYEHCKQAHNPRMRGAEHNENSSFREEFVGYRCDCRRYKSAASLSLVKHYDFCEKVSQERMEVEDGGEAPDLNRGADTTRTSRYLSAPENDWGLCSAFENAEMDEARQSATDEDDDFESFPESRHHQELSQEVKTVRKKNGCLYCNLRFTNVAHHLERAHADEDDVRKFSKLPKGSAERRRIIELLRKKGNYEYKKLTGEIIPTRSARAKNATKQNEYFACPRCSGMFLKRCLRRHFKNCISLDEKPEKYERSLTLLSRQHNVAHHKDASETLKCVCSHMQDGPAAKIIRTDPLLVSFGNRLCVEYEDPRRAKEIRAKLRLLARFLIAAKTINEEITDLLSVLNPKFYFDVVRAVNRVANHSGGNNDMLFQKPGVAFTVGLLVKQLTKHAKWHIIRKGLVEHREDLMDFRDLLDECYDRRVNRFASFPATEARKRRLPADSDVNKLFGHLVNRRNALYDDFTTNGFGKELWRDLASYTLTSIQLSNRRRRSGEIERMTIADLEARRKIDKNDLEDRTGSAASEYVRVRCKGHYDRNVSVVIDVNNLRCLEMVVKYRGQAGVTDANPYVFGLPTASYEREQRHLNACMLMKRFSIQCGAADPKKLRATLLRKHLAATHSASLKLSETATPTP